MPLAKAIGVNVLVMSGADPKQERAPVMGAECGTEVVWPRAMKSLARGGRLVTCGATTGDQPPTGLRRIFIRRLQILGSTHGDFSGFRAVLSFIEPVGITPVIDSEFPLDRIHEALARLETGQQFGKVASNLVADLP